MNNGWMFAILIWITSVFVGSFFTDFYMALSAEGGINSIMETYFIILFYSGINSIPTAIVFSICLEILTRYNFTKRKFLFVICTIAYILCFLTIYFFLFHKNDMIDTLTDPFLWIVFICYCAGLSAGIFYFSKWFIIPAKEQNYEV